MPIERLCEKEREVPKHGKRELDELMKTKFLQKQKVNEGSSSGSLAQVMDQGQGVRDTATGSKEFSLEQCATDIDYLLSVLEKTNSQVEQLSQVVKEQSILESC